MSGFKGTFGGAMPVTSVTPAEVYRFTILGNPVPKARPRLGKGRTFTPKETVLAESAVLDAFFDAYPFWTPVDYILDLDVTFYRDSRRRVDVDNLAKLVQDALNGHAFADDSQVVDLHGHKFFTTKDRARTEVVMRRVVGDRTEVLS